MSGSVWVIGGANMDILGTASNHLKQFDSNVGTIDIRFGGVGRNIAQSLALMETDVKFVSCFGADAFSSLLKEDCERLGMDTSYSLITHDYPSSMYLAILNHEHDMVMAINDMRILESFNQDSFEKVFQDIQPEDILVIDANLKPELLKHIVAHTNCRIASDPVSVAKAKHLEPVLKDIHIFKPNQYEAEAFSGIEITDESSAKESLQFFLDRGIKEIIISLSTCGLLVGSKEKMTWFKHRTLNIENATGGGDCFLGAYLSQRVKDVAIDEAVRFALCAAILTVECEEAKRRKITKEIVLNNIDTMDIQEIVL